MVILYVCMGKEGSFNDGWDVPRAPRLPAGRTGSEMQECSALQVVRFRNSLQTSQGFCYCPLILQNICFVLEATIPLGVPNVPSQVKN